VSRALDLREAGWITAWMLTRRLTPQTPAQLDAALRHRDRVLDDLAALLRSGAQMVRDAAGPLRVSEAAADPVRALLGVLELASRLGVTPALPPTELLSRTAPTNGGWRDLNRALLVTAHDWSRVRGTAPEQVQWGLVADVAAIAGGVALLQEDLAAAGDTLGAAWSVRGGPRSSAAQIRLYADAALDVATRGPTRDAWTPIPAAPSQAQVITSAADVVSAAVTLARMLADHRAPLSSKVALQILSAHAMTSTRVAKILEGAGDPDTAALLTRHADLLLAGGRAAHERLWSNLRYPNRRAQAQAQELFWSANRALDDVRAPATRRQAARQYAAVVPAITIALTAQINHYVGTGAWAVIDTDGAKPALTWRPTTARDLPGLRNALETAGETVRALGPSTVYPDTSITGSPDAAHRVVAAARRNTETRPWLPAVPAHPTWEGNRLPPPSLRGLFTIEGVVGV
jgi:hypothetical protein